MATVIEYYVPERLRKQTGKWIPPKERGKIIPFPVLEETSVLGDYAWHGRWYRCQMNMLPLDLYFRVPDALPGLSDFIGAFSQKVSGHSCDSQLTMAFDTHTFR